MPKWRISEDGIEYSMFAVTAFTLVISYFTWWVVTGAWSIICSHIWFYLWSAQTVVSISFSINCWLCLIWSQRISLYKPRQVSILSSCIFRKNHTFCKLSRLPFVFIYQDHLNNNQYIFNTVHKSVVFVVVTWGSLMVYSCWWPRL